MISEIGSRMLRSPLLLPVLALQVAWQAQSLPTSGRALPIMILAICVIRPIVGMLLVASLAPLAGPVSGLLQSPYPAPKLLEQLVLAAITGALLRDQGGTTTRIGLPGTMVATIAAASAAVTLGPNLASTKPGASAGTLLESFWRSDYFEMAPPWEPVSLAALIAEAALFSWLLERHARRAPSAVEQVLRMTLAGAAGASAVPVLRIIAGALRSPGFVDNVASLFLSVRLSVLSDVNAAASMLLLPLLGGVGLLVSARRRLPYAGVLALVCAGLWLTGSRVALASLGVIAFVAGLRTMWRRAGRTRVAVAAVACVITVAVAAMELYPAARNMDVRRSIETRLTLTKAGIAMFKISPVWGIGIGSFDDATAELVGSEISQMLGRTADGRLYDRENAHNNFVQVLAEQGVVGLAALLFLVGNIWVAAAYAETRTPNAIRRWILYAISACLLTWLTGHPLLVPEFVFVFFTFLGLLGALSDDPQWRSRRWPAWFVIAGLVATVPGRSSAALRTANFEYLGTGLSLWQHDDAFPYRRAGKTFALYVPASERAMVPMRREAATPDPLALEVRRDGRLIASMYLGGDEWKILRFPYRGEPRKFMLLEFRVLNAPAENDAADQPLVRVGKPGESR